MFKNLHPKCANSACDAAFEWTAGGKFFRFHRAANEFEPDNGEPARFNNAHQVEHLWLCERCSRVYTLDGRRNGEALLRPLWPQLPAADNNMLLPAP